ncbi:MAG TPA: HupE / UreJ protein [Maribacter sp.]|uniref:HupE/UreJ family protein n=1 Tax=unclassified Maribacter TaxID=2615042 RepID=UPI000EBDB57F|nr:MULTISPECIES: HupE/UreJ family protein [unclassified Maribacter]HAF78340.1 HupE / UreJ protein [Maribacter sp.]|tara:strand:+ start:559 stop:1143 length:585 start_codon:yes stop_codon:yes gene_type:complete
MQEFWFYIKLGLQHVLDINAYDHILFLTAMALPFTFKSWKNVLWLATVFTITHCLALVFSVYEIMVVDATWIEFLIPVTILATALFNIVDVLLLKENRTIWFHMLATGFFGLVHGFGFSNYFKMMIMGEEDKLAPLLGFAGGIELSQVVIVLLVLVLAFVVQTLMNVKQRVFILVGSIVVILITLPLLYETFPF